MLQNTNVIGLDIGTDSIKLVEIAHNNNTLELVTYGIASHNLNLEGYWDRGLLRQLATMIEDLMQSGDFKGYKTVMSVQSKEVYVSTMDFEVSWDHQRIEDEINQQAPYFLPYPPDEMRVSWSLIANDPKIEQYTGKKRAIINALPDFVITNSKNLFEHVDLDGVVLENQTISQVRSTLRNDRGNTVLVDYGGRHTTFSIIVDGVLRSSTHFPIGSEKITEDLSEAMGLERETANYFKHDIGLVNLYELPKQVDENFAVIKTELETFIDLNTRASQKPNKVVFTGGGSYTPGFVEYFRELKVPTFLGNCTMHLYIPPHLTPHIMPLSNQLSTAIGLASRSTV
jgi:type IV pilus assembly protein PilM